MTRLRPFVLALALIATVSMSAVAQQARADNPEKFIASLGDRALQVLVVGSQDPSERYTAFRRILDEGFDLTLIGRYALGRYWRRATPEQRSEYVKLFEDFIVVTYVARLSEYSGETLHVVSSRPDDQDTIVTSEIVLEGRPSIRVDWRVRNGDSDSSESKIIDVIVEGISMLLTQRDEFASVIQRSGGNVEGLLVRLREKSSDE
jgi:phospholipid transport system substrate-binding protein